MKYLITIGLIISGWYSCLSQVSVDDYFDEFRVTRVSNVNTEKQILNETNQRKLIRALEPYFNDTLIEIRRKAYYLTYRKSTGEPERNQDLAIHQFIKGCADENSNIVKQNLGYLKHFNKKAFDRKAETALEELLPNPRYEYYSDIYLLAGFLGVGYELMQRKYLHADTPPKQKWTLQLALARMGDKKAVDNCLAWVKEQDTNSDLMTYVIPDLIYTHQRAACEYCIGILNSDEKDCLSPNAESSAKVLCGYRVMELLASAIIGFPYKTDASGTLTTNDYTTALNETRRWFKNHPDFEMDYNKY